MAFLWLNVVNGRKIGSAGLLLFILDQHDYGICFLIQSGGNFFQPAFQLAFIVGLDQICRF